MKNLKRIMVLLIAVAMIFSMIPSTSFAWADTENPTGTGDESSSVFDVSEGNLAEASNAQNEALQEEGTDRSSADDISGFTVELWRGADPDPTEHPVPDEYGNYVWTPESAGAGHKFTYRITFQINAGSSRV